MDAYLRSLLRRYTAGEADLAPQIASAVARAEGVQPLPKYESPATPPKTFDDLVDILTKDITPLGVVDEWEDDHTVSGRVKFAVGDKCFIFNLYYCGAEALAAFSYADSPRAYVEAVEVLRREVLMMFNHCNTGDEPEYPERDIDDELIRELRTRFQNGEFDLCVAVSGGYSRADLAHLFKQLDQVNFEKRFGPLQPYTWNGSRNGVPEQRWVKASSIVIEPGGSFWYYDPSSARPPSSSFAGSSDYSQVIQRVPLDSPSLHQIPLSAIETCAIQ